MAKSMDKVRKMFGLKSSDHNGENEEGAHTGPGEGATGVEKKTKFADAPPSPSAKKKGGDKKHVRVVVEVPGGEEGKKKIKPATDKKKKESQAPPSVRVMCREVCVLAVYACVNGVCSCVRHFTQVLWTCPQCKWRQTDCVLYSLHGHHLFTRDEQILSEMSLQSQVTGTDNKSISC